MANVNITGFKLDPNGDTYYPRPLYTPTSQQINYLTTENGNIEMCINLDRPINKTNGTSFIIRLPIVFPMAYEFVSINDGVETIYFNYNGYDPYLYFDKDEVIELVYNSDRNVYDLVNYNHNMINITYAYLKNARDNGKLIPGMKYRIFDYVTQCYYTAKSAEHPFDIVVTALDNKTLDENAKAMKREGDTYFDGCDLSKWEIKYTLDADPERFEWAKSGEEIEYKTYYMRETNGILDFESTTGLYVYDNDGEHTVFTDSFFTIDNVDYYATNHPNSFVMKSGYTTGNDTYVLEPDYEISGVVDRESPYWIDEDGIKYFLVVGSDYYISEDSTDRNLYNIYLEEWEWCTIENISYPMEGNIIKVYLDTDSGKPLELYCNTDDLFYDMLYTKQMCYKLYDSFGNFNYLLRKSELYVGGTVYLMYEDLYPDVNGYVSNVYPELTKGVIYHMKDEWGNECPYDFKNIMFKTKGFELVTNSKDYYTFTNQSMVDMSKSGKYLNNIIKPYFVTNKPYVDKGQYRLNNIILCANPTTENTNNTFGYNCRNICIGSLSTESPLNIKYNKFGDSCYDINAIHTTSTCSFYYNTFGDSCGSNTFGMSCSYNTFGDECIYNKFGRDCTYNNFGIRCSHNKLLCSSNYNNFRNRCVTNKIGKYSSFNVFGDSCSYNTFGDYFKYNTLMNYVRYCYIKQGSSTGATIVAINRSYCYYNTFNTGVQYVTLVASGSMGSPYVTKNIVVHSDLNSTSTKYIGVTLNKETVTNVYYKTPTTVTYGI